MSTRNRAFALGAVFVASLLSTLHAEAGNVSRHLALLRSEPAADSTVVSPSAITLWFTQAPQEGSTQIRLLAEDGSILPAGEATVLSDEPTAFSAKLERPLAPGRYTVAWRAMATDGHVLNEEFDFTVRSGD